MRKKISAILLCCAAIAVSAAEFPIKAGSWSGSVDSKGAVLKSLFFKGKRLTRPGDNSFEDYVMGNGGGKIELCEDFFKLNFEPLSVRRNKIILSACGTGAFAGLRVTKTYAFDSRKPEFSVTWEYKNIGSRTIPAGLRTRCFFTNAGCKSNTYHFPKDGKMVQLDYPGATSVDHWILNPGIAFLAVHGKTDPAGVILLPPKEIFGRLFCYFSQVRIQNTQEFFLNDQPIAPGKSISFTLKGIGSNNIPAELAQRDLKKYQTGALKGSKLRLPLIYTGKQKEVLVSYGSAASAEKHLDLFPERQLDESFRTLILPKGTDTEALSLYQMANNSAMLDRPVPFRLLKDEKGNNILKFRVPGINPGNGGGVEWDDEFAYEAWGAKNCFGVSKFACRLFFRKGGVIDNTIPEGDAELIYNGDFSKVYPQDNTIPDGYRNPVIWNRNTRRLDITFKKPGLRLQWNKDSKQKYPVFMFPVRVERGVKYTFSTKVSCTNPLTNWIVISISFFDKNGKPINRTKDIKINDARKALPMMVRSKSFYPPEGAVRGDIQFRVYDKAQVMDIVNVSLKPEPFRAEVRTPEQILRNELTSSYVPGLDLLENLNFSTVTPHREFFRNPAQALPKLLYLTGNHSSSYWIKQAHRRHLIELCERAKFDYTYIPLMQKIASSQGASAWHFNYANTLEPYTLLKLRSLKDKFDAVMMNQVNFSCVPKEVIAQLKKYRANGAPLIFYNCFKVPQELLGKKMPAPEHIMATLPQLRKVSPRDLSGNLQFYSGNGAPAIVWNTGLFEYWNVRALPFVPKERQYEQVPNYYGQDFPYWEYFYLAQLKALRSAAKREGDVVAQKAVPGALTLKSKAPCKVKIQTVVRDFYGRTTGKAEAQIALKSGVNTIVPPLPAKPLTGGISIVDFKICDAKGRDLDCGAYKVETPALPLKVTMSNPELIFGRKAPVSFKVESVPGAVYDCEIVDSEGRSVWKKTGKETAFSAPLSFPYTRLYYLYVRAEADKKSALIQQEFALERAPLQPYDVTMTIWGNRPAYSRLIRNLGFKMNYTNFGLNHMKYGSVRAQVTDGCEPITFGSGGTLNRTERVYRHNAVTDPVRNPCFSDPVRAKKVEEILAMRLQSFKAKYYGIRCHIVADEADLGRSVCFSEHCKKAFREWLKPRYSSLAELNKVWGTAYKSWDEVVPVQYKELKDKERMAQYIEHKLFMNLVFARDWAGATLNGLRKEVPGSVSGLSGTQDPGYSYDWVQMMKYNPFLMYYGGNQVNAVLDFAPEGSLHGQWLGYARGFNHAEVNAKGRIWQDIFRGANLICKFSCETLIGDVSAAPNLLYFTEAGREISAGPGARILHGKELGRDIGILYSQSSLLCAFSNQIGSQNVLNMWSSWPALLTDLGVRYKMISYEDLEVNVPKFKVVILPGAFSLSKNQLANLKKFAEKGGTIIADCGPGWYDGHGNKAETRDAEKLFGISRKQAKLYPSDAPQFNTLPLGETGLKLDGSKAQMTVSGEPVAITKSYGKGKAVLLNLGIGSYQSIKLGGVGGEETNVVSGEAKAQKALQSLITPLLAQCKAPFKVEGMTGATIFLRQDGANYVAGILPVVENVPFYKDLKRKQVKLTFPVKGHLYLVRSGKYLGYGNSCKLALRAGDPELISILPEKVKLQVTAPTKLAPGAVCNFSVKIPGGKGNHVLHFEVRRPDGTLPFGYDWNSYAPCSGSSYKFQFARNDVKGTWKIIVRDVDSGMTTTNKIELR